MCCDAARVAGQGPSVCLVRRRVRLPIAVGRVVDQGELVRSAAARRRGLATRNRRRRELAGRHSPGAEADPPRKPKDVVTRSESTRSAAAGDPTDQANLDETTDGAGSGVFRNTQRARKLSDSKCRAQLAVLALLSAERELLEDDPRERPEVAPDRSGVVADRHDAV